MRRLVVVLAFGIAFAAAGPLSAEETGEEGDSSREPFALDWWTADSGGGAAAGGDFDLLATIGQPDTAVSLGEDYVLMGGFLAGGDLGVLFTDGFESGTTDRWSFNVGGRLVVRGES